MFSSLKTCSKFANVLTHCKNVFGVRSHSIAANPAVGMNKIRQDINSSQLDLLKEICVIVDEQDRPITAETKENCHLMTNIRKGMLHRAFSVFLFNTNGDLLLQQRSDCKITFPGYFTNTCCSHPLYTKEELEEDDVIGVKRAAQRRLYQELGIPKDEVPIDEMHFLTRIHYMAPYNETWGEHEIDYILFLQQNVSLNPNPNEVKSWEYVSRKQMKTFLESLDAPLTPWFQLILNKFLFYWWDNLTCLDEIKDPGTIHRLI